MARFGRPAAPFRRHRSWQDVRDYSRLKKSIQQLCDSIRKRRKRLEKAKKSLKNAVSNEENLEDSQNKVDKAERRLNKITSKRERVQTALKATVRSIIERNKVLLMRPRDLKALLQLIKKHRFKGEISVAPTKKGGEVWRRLKAKGMKPTIEPEV